jgi:hypothetical protein
MLKSKQIKALSCTFSVSIMMVSWWLATSGCYKDSAEKLYPVAPQCDTMGMKYSSNVSPILSGDCATGGCHTTANKVNAGGYAFDSYSETMLAVPNNKLMNSIKHLNGYSQMPKGGNKLPDCDIAQIQAWINQGSPNN